MKEINPSSRKDITEKALEPIPNYILLKRELVDILEGSMAAYETEQVGSLKLYLVAKEAWNRANDNPFLNLAIRVELEKRRKVFNEGREVVEQGTIEEMYNPETWGAIFPEKSGITPDEFVRHRATVLKELLEGLFED